ncbi:MAG: peptidase M6 [Marmoricola sp.]
MHHRPRAAWAIAATAATLASLGLHSPATAAPDGHDTGHDSGHAYGKGHHGDGVKPVPKDIRQNKERPVKKGTHLVPMTQQRSLAPQAVSGDPQVGDVRKWVADDEVNGTYLKDYTLRGVGDHIQVWVANDTSFPAGDCRNALGLADITDAQVASFVHEFDTNIYPKESASFSVPDSRDGSKAFGYRDADGTVHPIGSGQVSADRAGDTAVLVDNVRDANYYTPDSPSGQTYIAGFFYGLFDDYADRNIMTIDAYDWLHRTGATPPDDSADPAYQACPYASGAPRPHLYEGTFAHEYQHLLESYQDPDEVSWVNEGLSDYAQTLVGYVDPSTPVTDPAADSHIACFSGFLADKGYGGPENSLTSWQDQGAPEILCDYGAAYSFMQYLFGHYGGEKFMSALHQEAGNGLTGLDNVLDRFGSSDSAMDVVHKWAATAALDNVLDKHRKLTGGDRADYTEDSLGLQISWSAFYDDINHDGVTGDDGNEAYSTPGAPPNGSDYVRLRDAQRQYLSARQLEDITFRGSRTLAPDPVQWTVDTTPPDGAGAGYSCAGVPDGTGAAALYSGCGANLDRAIVKTVDVPATGSSLTFDAKWDTEEGWDFGFVQVYDPASRSYRSVDCTDTTTSTDPGAIPAVQANVPGFTGDSGDGFRAETCDLSAYAGRSVELAFRYVTDSGVNEGGFWVRNIALGGTPVADGSSLTGWQSATQAHPVPVSGFTVQLVGYDAKGKAFLHRLRLADGFTGALSGKALRKAVGKGSTTVSAIVTQNDPTETVGKYAHYTLSVNGVEQPGG